MVKEKGVTTLSKIESHTGLNNISATLTADFLMLLKQEDIIVIDRTNGAWNVIADVAKLTQIKEQVKTPLPRNYGKPWSDNDVLIMCELHYNGSHPHQIGLKLERTENSISMALSILRKAYKWMPLIKKYAVVRHVASEKVSPNPER